MNKLARIYLSSPHLGVAEFEFVKEAFATNWIAPLGPHVDKFESELAAMLEAVAEEKGEGRREKGGGGTSSGRQTTDDGRRTAAARGVPIGGNPPASDVRPPPSGSLHAAALSSGTAALHLALRMLGLKPGDEVFCSTLTFSASANPIAYERATPVFIDSERASWNMDPARLEEALKDRAAKGKLPKAVILVHLYGQSADLDAIAGLCEKYGVPLIEDAAEALGAVYYGKRTAEGGERTTDNRGQMTGSGGQMAEGKGQKADDGCRTPKRFAGSPSSAVRPPSSGACAPGTRGLMGIFSFNGNKIITTSGGGMLVSRDEALIKKAKFLATQARDPAPHYQHSEIGFNYRLSNVLAGIGRGQLRVLSDRVEARRANCAFYQQAFADLPGIVFMPEAPWGRSNRWLTCITVDPKKFGADRETIRLALEAENIEARPVWKPMHLQPVFAGCPAFGGEVAEDLFEHGLCLPSGSNLTPGDLQRVVEVVRRVARRAG